MSEGSITWRVGLLGAISALVGSLIGAGSTVYINDQNSSDRDAERLTSQREGAYRAMLAEAQRQKATLARLELPMQSGIDFHDPRVDQLVARSKRLVGLSNRAARPLSLVIIYGDADAVRAAFQLNQALTDAGGSAAVKVLAELGSATNARQAGRLFEGDLRTLDKEIGEFTVTVRTSLNVPPFDLP